MAIDAGDLPTAQALAVDLPFDEAGVATRWYLARAMGESALMERWAAEWRQQVQARDRDLQQLIPIHLRATP